MIPVFLKLSNFTSYSQNPPELDFTKFQLAAISGLNGAGKSSLLDAITWCVWGVSRAGDSADELVHKGSDSMQVEFSFELDGNQFTVKRRRLKKAGGSTALEFWSSGPKGSSPVYNLTEGTIKATQQKIIDTLHLTFETFTNSAYLRQGHADEFTTKGPTDRKRILADILGLDHYDKLAEKAKEKAKEIQTRLTLLDYQLLEIEAELSQKEEREKQLTQIQLEERQLQDELDNLEKEIKKIEQERQQTHIKTKTLEQQKQTYLNIKKELDDLGVQIELKKQAQKEYQTILEQKEIIERNYQSLTKLQEEKKVLDEKRGELIKIKDELVEIEKVINDRENKRKDAVSKLAIKIKELQTNIDALAGQNNQLKKEKSICPTCQQPINTLKTKEILESNNKVISEKQQEINNLEETIKKYQSFSLPEYQTAKQKRQQIKALVEQTQDYQRLSSQINELEKYNSLYLKLQQAQVGVKTHQEAVADLQKIYLSKQKELEKSQIAEKDLLKNLQALSQIEQTLLARQQVRQVQSQKLMEVKGKMGEARQLVSRSVQLQELFDKKQKEKNQLTAEKQIFEELALAFGKKGIQAMIIEAAIPEIEDEANSLLASLTDGRMKVSIHSQKETKTKLADGEKGIIETLDIIISDEMGERPYELYSGGEAFRVNFAVRLAISKLLTLRAGTKLQFLVIDEGFGSQDAPGKTRLIEVIDAIKDDFEKILIITHLEELKDEFPVRIEVSKNSQGSTFELVGI